jgi:hypothetical protein
MLQFNKISKEDNAIMKGKKYDFKRGGDHSKKQLVQAYYNDR